MATLALETILLYFGVERIPRLPRRPLGRVKSTGCLKGIPLSLCTVRKELNTLVPVLLSYIFHADDHLMDLSRLIHIPGEVGAAGQRGQKRQSKGGLHLGGLERESEDEIRPGDALKSVTICLSLARYLICEYINEYCDLDQWPSPQKHKYWYQSTA